MNKQQLAAKIWETANKMRSKIEANEYKDYILGFIFYKYLSDRQVTILKDNEFTDEDIKQLNENEVEVVNYVKESVGYFIAYDNLFSTWIELGRDFDVSNVTDALSAFNRLINPTQKLVFEGIFNTLQTGLSKLGENSSSRTKAIRDLIYLIKDIPMNGKQDYDVLGFIYEYLIGMFAANAGKKAGEFYTPHEVSVLMSDIIADHLKERSEIRIYDPTSGSGSLLINIGNSLSKHIENENNIKYYAQELKQNTYNLTRMNLVMRGILPDNIVTRNGDTLEEDWPYFDESNPAESYDPLYVDAVVSNPPYSQQWDPNNKESDPRYARFGLAPKSKADYAFLLHDLYHLKPDGIMTIVLPHGVLFRGGEEGTIRKNLIENNHIDAIIGLPANIFFGTGIPTIVIVLKQRRENTDVLMVDASKGYEKVGKNNVLRASDIKKIVDIVVDREEVTKYSRIVSREEIRSNEYNLNIPRYVDSSEVTESWDIYASMYGGVPKSEIDMLDDYWKELSGLKEFVFTSPNEPYSELTNDNVKDAILEHSSVKSFVSEHQQAFESFGGFLEEELIENLSNVVISKEKEIIGKEMFKRLEHNNLIDKYFAYQILDDAWNQTAIDLEVIQTEGFETIKSVEPNMVTKKKNGKDEEVQNGWAGKIIPFDLVQRSLLRREHDALKEKENRLSEITSTFDEILESMTEEEKELNIVNDTGSAFVNKEIPVMLKDILKEVSSTEIASLKEYISLSKKAEKIEYIHSCKDINWSNMEIGKDGTYSKKVVNDYLIKLQSDYAFDEETLNGKIVKVSRLLNEEKTLKSTVKEDEKKLHLLTKETIEKLTDEEAKELLKLKWIKPLSSSINSISTNIINDLVSKIENLAKKYDVTFSSIENEIKETEATLSNLIDQLVGNEYDMKGLSEFKKLLNGE